MSDPKCSNCLAWEESIQKEKATYNNTEAIKAFQRLYQKHIKETHSTPAIKESVNTNKLGN
jgi:hypothetical protein